MRKASSQEPAQQLQGFITKYDPGIATLARSALSKLRRRMPGLLELVYDNYNALAFGWSLTERLGHTFCSVAIGRTSKNVHFGFYWGSQISDPKKMLIGGGNQYRYILVKSQETFPKAYIKKLVKEAYANSLAKVKDKKQLREGLTITKSVSPAKRTARKASKNKMQR